MDIAGLKARLVEHGCFAGPIDNTYTSDLRAGVLKALTDGPDLSLTDADVAAAAADLGVSPAHIWTSWDLECTGSPFINGRPAILPERHRFSKNTGHRFDGSHPALSAPHWDRSWYPRTQDGRYAVLLEWIELDVDAAFKSCSYGGFQIMGENFALCEAPTPWAFAWRQSMTQADQLFAYTKFVRNAGLLPKLKACRPGDPLSCRPFCEGYNGTAERENHYEDRFAADLKRRLVA